MCRLKIFSILCWLVEGPFWELKILGRTSSGRGSFLMGKSCLLTDWRGKLSSQQGEACRTGKTSGREEIPRWSITILSAGAEGAGAHQHLTGKGHGCWATGSSPEFWGRGSATHISSGGRHDQRGLPATACWAGAGLRSAAKGLCAGSPIEVRGFKKLTVPTADTNSKSNVIRASLFPWFC